MECVLNKAVKWLTVIEHCWGYSVAAALYSLMSVQFLIYSWIYSPLTSYSGQLARWTKCPVGSTHAASSLSTAVEGSLTCGPRKTERPVPRCCFRCVNPGWSSPLQTEFHLFMWDRQFVFFCVQSQKGQRWGPETDHASSAFVMVPDLKQQLLFLSLTWLIWFLGWMTDYKWLR